MRVEPDASLAVGNGVTRECRARPRGNEARFSRKVDEPARSGEDMRAEVEALEVAEGCTYSQIPERIARVEPDSSISVGSSAS